MGQEKLSQIYGLTGHVVVGPDQGDRPCYLLSSPLVLRYSLQHVEVRVTPVGGLENTAWLIPTVEMVGQHRLKWSTLPSSFFFFFFFAVLKIRANLSKIMKDAFLVF